MTRNPDELSSYLHRGDGEEFTDPYLKRYYQIEKMMDMQSDRFHHKYDTDEKFAEIVKKIETKYESVEYKRRWHKRSIEPQRTLYWLIYDVAAVYGRYCTQEEWELLGSQFTTEMFYYKGYFIQRVDGQDSTILVISIEEIEGK